MDFFGSGGETPLLALLTGYLNIDGRGGSEDGKGLRVAQMG